MTQQEALDCEGLALGWLEQEGWDPALEAFYARWIASFEAGWGGDAHLEEGLRRVALLRAVIPAATLEALVLAAPVFPWQLGPAALTWEVVQRAAVAQMSYPVGYPMPPIYILRLFGREGASLLGRLLVEGKPCDGAAVARALRWCGTAEAVPGLMVALQSPSRPVRAAAQVGLVHVEAPEVVLAALPDALGSGRKDVRALAAEVLAMLPPSAEAYQQALEALAKEKILAVREVLERVQAPAPAVTLAPPAAMVEALAASEGAGWEVWAATPDAVVLALVAAIFDDAQRRRDWPYGGLKGPLVEALGAALSRLEPGAVAMRAVVGLVDEGQPGASVDFLDTLQAREGVDLLPWVGELARSRRLVLVPVNTAFGMSQQRLLEWLFKRGEPHREEALLLGLELKDKSFRKRCADQLRVEVSSGLNAALIALLVQEAAPEEARMLAAELLAERGAGEGKAALGEVAAAGKVKKGAKLREAAAAALGRLQAAGL